eukprot:5090522-Alexandrium_andersonii.AAC.1
MSIMLEHPEFGINKTGIVPNKQWAKMKASCIMGILYHYRRVAFGDGTRLHEACSSLPPGQRDALRAMVAELASYNPDHQPSEPKKRARVVQRQLSTVSLPSSISDVDIGDNDSEGASSVLSSISSADVQASGAKAKN